MSLTVTVGEVRRGDLHRNAAEAWMAEHDARTYDGLVVIETTNGPRTFAECQLIVVER